jgi:hypothetical protein
LPSSRLLRQAAPVSVERAVVAAALVGALVCALARPATADCADPFRDPDDILDFHLRTTTEAWNAFQASEKTGDCDDQYPYFPAGFRCGDDEPYIGIEFRRKRDRSETWWKLPIKLDFNRTIAGQRWPAARGELGFRKLTLNSGQADDAGRAAGQSPGGNPGTLSALLTEHLAWRLMRQEIPEASGVAYARLTVHLTDGGAEKSLYQGLYILIEDIDRTSVRARFADDQGLLVKTTDLNCLDEVVFDDGPPNAAADRYATWLADDPASFPGGWYARTDAAMHLDPLLRQEALRELLANTGDTVLGNRNNYFALDLPGDRRLYLPWDLDDMFRPFPQVRAPDTALFRNCPGEAVCASRRIGFRIRDDPEIRPRYLEILCELANGVGHEDKLVAEMGALDALIRPLIAAEVDPVWAPMGRDPLDAGAAGTYAAEVERMKTWIPARIQAVRRMVEAEGIACPAACEDGATATCERLGRPSRRVCIGGRWAACEDPGGAGGAGGAGGTGGAGGAGGAGGGDGGGAADAGGLPAPATARPQGGCSCAVAARGATHPAPAALLALLLTIICLTRRSRLPPA